MEINQYNDKGQLDGYWEYKERYLTWGGNYINDKPIGLWIYNYTNGDIFVLQFYSQ